MSLANIILHGVKMLNEGSVMTCRSLCSNGEKAITLISDIDASRWRLKLDYNNGTGTILPIPGQVFANSVSREQRIILRFSPPRQQLMGTG